MQWSEFDKFGGVNKKYLPECGEGETMATQICTAVNKLVYKWYNDGDVYDNTHYLEGWANDLSSYANWLRKYAGAGLLDQIEDCVNEREYEELLYTLCIQYLNPEYLDMMAKKEKVGTIYECDGPFTFDDGLDDLDHEEDWDEEDW